MAKFRSMAQKVVRPGAFTGENGPVSFDSTFIKRLDEEAKRMVADGVVIPLVAEENERHPRLKASLAAPVDDPLFRGQVLATYLQGDWLHAIVDTTDETIPADMRVSAWIEPRFDVGGKTYSPALLHLLLTRDAAVPDQGPPIFLRMPASGALTIAAALSHDDRILLERFKTHRATPHLFPHPGHRLRVEALLTAETRSGGFRGSGILSPPVKSIPPDDEKLLWQTIERGLGVKLTEEELLEADQYLHRLVWSKDSDPFKEAGRMVSLLFTDRLSAIAGRLNATVDPGVAYANPPSSARLALGYQQRIPAETEKLIWRLVDKELALDLSDSERDGVRYFLLGHDWTGDTSVYTIAQQIADSWVNERVAAFREKVRPSGAQLSASAQALRHELEQNQRLRQVAEREAIKTLRAAGRM